MSRTKPTPPHTGAAGAGPATGGAASAATARADANRRRILDVAHTELTRDPDASMDQIARGAGVVRRTVYGHFPSRDALVTALLDEAVEAVLAAHSAAYADVGTEDPTRAIAAAMLGVWRVTDRYRLLLSLAQRAVTMDGIRERLAPMNEAGVAMIQRALDEGRFTTAVPPRALVYVLESIVFGLMEAVNDGILDTQEAGRAAATTFLTAAGLPLPEATALVNEVAAKQTD
ncbi:TetR/AcrR family transcriptional regulator [Streptomyces sp. NRRL B-1347]|uniref:TetR/AcrR family transcriptional regulator n=1 Tax=Streptomyces sp. NRRL B-1347 TaxID=1476877 RepID=UPI0004C8BB72|nr:TetR/AcrR family transcriptional regulator [Streptomyces sp. NRRL B-1347]